jgi:hypothetical protein
MRAKDQGYNIPLESQSYRPQYIAQLREILQLFNAISNHKKWKETAGYLPPINSHTSKH